MNHFSTSLALIAAALLAAPEVNAAIVELDNSSERFQAYTLIGPGIDQDHTVSPVHFGDAGTVDAWIFFGQNNQYRVYTAAASEASVQWTFLQRWCKHRRSWA